MTDAERFKYAEPYKGEFPEKVLNSRERAIIDRLNGKWQGTFAEFGCLIVNPSGNNAILYVLDDRPIGTRPADGPASLQAEICKKRMGDSVIYEIGRYLQGLGMMDAVTGEEFAGVRDDSAWHSENNLQHRIFFEHEERLSWHQRDNQRFMSVSSLRFKTPEEVQAMLGLMGADDRARSRVVTYEYMHNAFDHALPNFTLANQMLDAFDEARRTTTAVDPALLTPPDHITDAIVQSSEHTGRGMKLPGRKPRKQIVANFGELIKLSPWVKEGIGPGATYRMNCHTPKDAAPDTLQDTIDALSIIMGVMLVNNNPNAERELLESMRIRLSDPKLEHAMLTSHPRADMEVRISPKVEIWQGKSGADICFTVTEQEYKNKIEPFLVREGQRPHSGAQRN